MQDINLLPQSEVFEQTKVKAVKFSTIFSIILLVLVVLGSGYILYLNSQTKQKIQTLDSQIDTYRKDIISRSDIEVTVRNLDKKNNALKNIFSTQKKYSLLMEELRSRKPDAVYFESLDLRGKTINLNGLADNYIAIADFINNLSNNGFEGGVKGLEQVFTSVEINSVNMETSKNRIAFFVEINFNDELLK